MTQRTAYSAIVFDLDGTLIDTWPGLLGAIRAHLPARGESLDPAALRLALSLGIDAVYDLAARQAGLEGAAAAQAQRRMAAGYVRDWLPAARPYAGAHQALQELRARGYTLGLCTNRSRGTTQQLLALSGWSGLFAGVVCLDEGEPPKPHPRPLLALIERLGALPAGTLFVGDSRVDAACAGGAGVDFAAHLRGYHARPDELEPRVLAFEHYAELPGWVARRHASLTEAEHG